MSISSRLLVLILSALFGMIVLVAVGTGQMKSVYDDASYSSVNSVPSILVLDKAILNFSRIRIRLYRLALNADPSKESMLVESVHESQKAFEQALKDYEPLISDDKDKSFLDADKEVYSAYAQDLSQLLEAYHQNKKDDIQALLTKLANQADIENTGLEKHMDYNKELANQYADRAAKRIDSATQILIGIAVLVITLIGALGYVTRRHLVRSLDGANLIVQRIASGNLLESQQKAAVSKDEVGRLLGAMERMRGDLASTIKEVVHHAHEVANSAEGLSRTAAEVAASSASQSNSSAGAAAAVEELTVSIDHISHGANDTNTRATHAGDLAHSGGQAVAVAADHISDIVRRIEHTAELLEKLSAQVTQIGGISAVISEVADQTNLLALNAAIEAARAGEQGRGFAVVADEVRGLAERTTRSVQEISAMIATIEKGADAAVSSMRDSQSAIGKVVESTQQASSAMVQIRTAASTVSESVGDISAALQEQRAASTELAKNVEIIAQMAEENATVVATVSSTARQLAQVSDQLRSGVARFTV